MSYTIYLDENRKPLPDKEPLLLQVNPTYSPKVTEVPFPVTASKLTTEFFVKLNNPLLSSIIPNHLEILRSEKKRRSYFFSIPVSIFDHKPALGETAEPLFCADCGASVNSNDQLVIHWPGEAKLALQELFPVSTALSLLLSDAKSPASLKETLCVAPALGKWIFYPEKQAQPTELTTEECAILLDCLKNYAKFNHMIKTSVKTSGSKRNHAAQIKESTHWMDACEYTGDLAQKANCIYSLATEPDENGICSVYVGEAKNDQTQRIKLFRIDGKDYIDHTEEEARAHRFTRFRVDILDQKAYPYLHDTQDAAIGILSMLERECPNGYRMTNIAQGASFNYALTKDKYSRNQKK